jgi:hypothetical protein
MRAVYSIAGMLAVISIIVIGRMIFPSPVNDVNQAMKSSVPTVGPAQDSAGLIAESDPVPSRETDNLLQTEERRTIAGNSVSASVQDSGKLIFTGIPWAKVYVNNRLIGETPIAKPLVLAAGEHSVMFVNPSFDPIMTTVTVFPNKEQTVAGNFLEHAGYVMCTVTPWADVYVDEQYKDTTPLTKPIMVSAGKRTLRFKNSAFGDIVKEITVSPKDTAFISISFIQ